MSDDQHMGRRAYDRMESDHDVLMEVRTTVEHLEKVVQTLVTRLEFAPVKLIAYGLVGLVVSGVLAAVLALVFDGRVN